MTDRTPRSGTADANAKIASDWWHCLASRDGPRLGQRRAALARMRRAATPVEVMQEPEALRLVARLPRRPDRVAVLAGVLAFVRETDERSIARTIGRKTLDDDESALVSEGRFRRLLQVQGHDRELMEAMRRLVRMAKGKLNVHDLSFAVLNWGDGVRKRWIFDYYNVVSALRTEDGAPAPPASTPSG